MKEIKGSSLIELIVCLTIAGIILGTVLPPLRSAINRGQQAEATNLLLSALHYARSSAVLSRTLVSLCAGPSVCATSRHWEHNLLLFNDQNKNGQIDNNEKLIKRITTPKGYSWYWSNFRSASYLQYEPDGTTRAMNGTFTLCHESKPLKQIVINQIGRIRTQDPTATARCP